jgi:hypothetical protein
MTNQAHAHNKKRFNLTILNENVENLELLRSLIEKRTSGRFSLAEIVNQLVADAIAAEQAKL